MGEGKAVGFVIPASPCSSALPPALRYVLSSADSLCNLLVCAQAPILAAKMGSSVKVWLVISRVFAQRVLMVGGEKGTLVTEWELTTAGAAEPSSLVDMVWPGERYQLPSTVARGHDAPSLLGCIKVLSL